MRKSLIFTTMMGFMSAELRADDVNFLDMFDLSYFGQKNATQSSHTKLVKLYNELTDFLQSDGDNCGNIEDNDRYCLRQIKGCLLEALVQPDLECSLLKQLISYFPKMTFNFKQQDQMNVENMQSFLKYLRNQYGSKIQEAIHFISQSGSGKELMKRLRQQLDGQKIFVVFGRSSLFQHPTRDVNRLQVCISPIRLAPELRLITGIKRAWNPLDVTLYHELLHCLHYLSCEKLRENYYFDGLEDKQIEQQINAVKLLLCHWLGERIDYLSDDWVSTNMKPWIQSIVLGRVSFYLEEFRTIFGDSLLAQTKQPCGYDLSETKYLIETNRPSLIRLAYTADDFTPQFWGDIFKGSRIFRWIVDKIPWTVESKEY